MNVEITIGRKTFEHLVYHFVLTYSNWETGTICELYRRWLKKLDLVLRQEHRAGEEMFVDYAGATIRDPQNGEVHAAAVFVAVLGASSYTFPEATTGHDLQTGLVRISARLSFSAARLKSWCG